MKHWRIMLLGFFVVTWLGAVFSASWFYHARSDQKAAHPVPSAKAEVLPVVDVPTNKVASYHQQINEDGIWPDAQPVRPPQEKQAQKKQQQLVKKKAPPQQKKKKKKKPGKPPLLTAIYQVGQQRWAVFTIDRKRKRLQVGDTIQVADTKKDVQMLIKIGATWIEYSELDETKTVKLFSTEK